MKVNTLSVIFLMITLSALYACEKTDPLPFLGKEQIGNLLIVEDHSQALSQWAGQGIRNAVLVNIDTHDDIRWMPENKIAALKDMYSSKDWKGLAGADSVADRGLYHIGSWIYAGARLGMFREVYWVIPHNIFSQGNTDHQLRLFLRNNLFSEKDINTFSLENSRFHGSVMGISLTVCSIESLPDIKGPMLLSIDTDFFPVYSDQHRVPYLAALHSMFTALYSRNYRVQGAALSYSVNGDYLKPHLRWVGDAAAMLIQSPAMLEKGPSELFILLQKIDNEYRAVNSSEMLRLTENYLPRYPEPSLLLYNAHAHFLQGDPEKAFASAMASCNKDARYCTGLPYIGSLYLIKDQCAAAEKFFRAAYTAEPMMSNGLYDFAHCLRDMGRTAEAIDFYQKDVALNGSFPTDFLIFETWLMSGQEPEAMASLIQAISGLERNPYAEVVNKRAAAAIYTAIDYASQKGLKEAVETMHNNRALKQMYIDYPRGELIR